MGWEFTQNYLFSYCTGRSLSGIKNYTDLSNWTQGEIEEMRGEKRWSESFKLSESTIKYQQKNWAQLNLKPPIK